MIKQRIYIDTSVIGGCFDDEFISWSNQLINDFKNGIYIPVLSELTKKEVLKAPIGIRDKYNEIETYNAVFLELASDSIELAKLYLKKNIIPKNFFSDGLHIALATINKIDILVSWNFKHIVHFDKIRLFNTTNIESGYRPIEIYSPREVATYED